MGCYEDLMEKDTEGARVLTPKVSAIMPNYNNGKYIGEAIESVLNQTYKNLELIVVDDGSTDNSREVISQYKDDRLKLMHIPHNGFPGAVKNCGIKVSKGEYIAFADSDDVWKNEKLEMQVNLLQTEKDVGLVHTDYEEIDICGRLTEPSPYKLIATERANRCKPSGWYFMELIYGNFIDGPTVLVKREALEKVGLFDPELEIAEDYDLWLKIARQYKIGYVDKILFQHRRHSSNITNNKIRHYPQLIKALTKALQLNSDIYNEIAPIIQQRIGNCYLWTGIEFLDRGQYQEATRYSLEAIKYNRMEPTRQILFLSSLLKTQAFFLGCRNLKSTFQNIVNVLKRQLFRVETL